MTKKIKAAVMGYGNVGRFAVDSVLAAPDMELAGIVEPLDLVVQSTPYSLVTSIEELGPVDVVLLCIPTRSVPETAAQLLARGINTVDSYDIHGELADLRLHLDAIARANGCAAVISAGWDPGSDSIIRSLFKFMAPRGLTYTNFGPGMSMGHSVAARAVAGVENALSMTIPVGTGVHRRMVYVQLQPGADLAQVTAAIRQDAYFTRDETIVIQVDDVERLMDMGHGVNMERKGGSGSTHNQTLSFSMKINNPALTGQIMTAAARASVKQTPGAYTMIQIPIIDYLYGETDEIIRRLV